MAYIDFKLTMPPTDERSTELWLQHAAGFILFHDMRDYAIDQIPPGTDVQTREKIIVGINDAVYGLMMIMDGVTGALQNDEYSVSFEQNIVLKKRGEVKQKINVFHGDGMCMGYHMWKEGDFGEDDIVTPRP